MVRGFERLMNWLRELEGLVLAGHDKPSHQPTPGPDTWFLMESGFRTTDAIITGMYTLRSSKLIASLVLAWFALFLVSAVASPVIKPGSMQIVCSAGGGMKVVNVDGNGGEVMASASMDCPLCVSVVEPPSQSSVLFVKRPAIDPALHPIAVAHIAVLTAPPLPSRGPPAAS